MAFKNTKSMTKTSRRKLLHCRMVNQYGLLPNDGRIQKEKDKGGGTVRSEFGAQIKILIRQLKQPDLNT